MKNSIILVLALFFAVPSQAATIENPQMDQSFDSGFLGIGDNDPGFWGIGDGKPGVFGIGTGRNLSGKKWVRFTQKRNEFRGYHKIKILKGFDKKKNKNTQNAKK